MWTDDDCLSALRQSADLLGYSPSKTEYDDHYESGALGEVPSSGTIQYRLGWNTAKEQLDMTVTERHESTRSVDESYFETIDTPEKAYWVGFLFCDGHLRRRDEYDGYSLSLALQRSDRHHIERFAADVESTYTIANRAPSGAGGPSSELAITNAAFCEPLAEYGLLASDDCAFPRIDQHVSACLRGMFDADGTFTGSQCFRFMQSTEETVVAWATKTCRLSEKAALFSSFKSDGKHYAQVSSRQSIQAFYDALWRSDDGPRMMRKAEPFQRFVED